MDMDMSHPEGPFKPTESLLGRCETGDMIVDSCNRILLN